MPYTFTHNESQFNRWKNTLYVPLLVALLCLLAGAHQAVNSRFSKPLANVAMQTNGHHDSTSLESSEARVSTTGSETLIHQSANREREIFVFKATRVFGSLTLLALSLRDFLTLAISLHADPLFLCATTPFLGLVFTYVGLKYRPSEKSRNQWS